MDPEGGVAPSLITLFFSQQHQQQLQQSKDGSTNASTQKQLQKNFIQSFLESQENPLDNPSSIEFKKYLYQIIINQLRSDGFDGAAQAVASSTMLPINSKLESNLSRLSELVHLGRQREHERSRDLVVPDDATMKMSTTTNPKSIRNTSFVTRFITTHKGSCRTAKFTRDGKYVATGSADCSLKLLDVEKMHYHHQTKVEVEDHTQARPVIRTFYDHTSYINDVDFHPTMPIVVSASRDKSSRFFDYSKASIKRSFHSLETPEAEVRSLQFHPSGDFMLLGTAVSATKQAAVRLLDLHSMKTFTSSNPNDQHRGDVNMCRWSKDGKLWVTAGKDGQYKIWDGVTGRCVSSTAAHQGAAYSAVFSSNGDYLLTNGQDGLVKLWDMSTGRQIRAYKPPGGAPAGNTNRYDCCFSYNEQAVVSSRDSDVLVWDTVTGDLVHKLVGHNKSIRWIAYSPIEQSFVSCSDDQRARFWADEHWESENGYV
ncbi:cleavage stimulation factor subunit 1 [Acrasis kona]|uniref:Cleavage stimulation factor 50 kDa subunit n=1 Tax=Acrasis kona TaxID=1008807 RepID=A0AAW2ZBW9_9EUKA